MPEAVVCRTTKKPSPKRGSNLSISQLPDLVLDQAAGGAGQLVHAADTGHIFTIDAGSVGGGAVLAHEHADTRMPLRCSTRTWAAVSATPAASS